PSAGPTAESLVTVVFRFDELDTGQAGNDAAWFVVDLVVAPEIAGIMEDDALVAVAMLWLEASIPYQPGQQFAVMDHFLEHDSDLFVFHLERVEAVRAGCDHTFHAGLPELFRIHLHQGIGQVFM